MKTVRNIKPKKTQLPKKKLATNRILFFLKLKKMTSLELAKLAGTTPSHISKIIHDKKRCISLPVAMRIASALGEKVESVFLL